jgi:ribosome-binding factor A
VRGAHLSALIERAVAEDNQHSVAAQAEDTKE